MSAWADFKETARKRPRRGSEPTVTGVDHGARREVRGWGVILSFEDVHERRWILTSQWRGRLPATDLDRDFMHRIAAQLGAGEPSDYRWPIAHAQGFDFSDPTWPDAVDELLDSVIPNRPKPRPGDRLCWTWIEPVQPEAAA